MLTLAQEEARQLDHSFMGTEHILLGLIHEGDGVGAQALRSLGISFQAVSDQVQEMIGTAGTVASDSPPFTPRAKKVLELALREALQLNHSYIGTEHLLLGLVREGEGVAATVLMRSERISGTSRGEQSHVRPSGERGRPTRRHPPTSRPAERPHCPRCNGNVSEAARFRTIVVAPDEGSADPLAVHVVYCTHCGTVLHMLEADVPS